MMLKGLLNFGDKVKFEQSENELLSLVCCLRFVPSGEGLLVGKLLACNYILGNE